MMKKNLKKIKRNRIIGFFLIISVFFTLLSCAGTLVKPDNSEKALENMVRMVWDAKKNGDWGKVYDCADLKFKKQRPKNKFHGNLQISDYKIINARIDESGEKATSEVRFKMNKMGMIFNITIKEIWLFQDGKWRLKLSDPVNPFTNGIPNKIKN